jgi:hypothetical protein
MISPEEVMAWYPGVSKFYRDERYGVWGMSNRIWRGEQKL